MTAPPPPRYDPDQPDVPVDQLVDMAEIGRRAGVARGTVLIWRRRHNAFPRPVVTFNIGPIFDWREVAVWLYRTGRLQP